jgi:geranylgeranyl pyrophosphate synthase
MPPVATLPLAACRAVNGQARDAVPISAALTAAILSARTFDDLVDRDRPGQLWQEVGVDKALYYGAALLVLTFDILSKANLPAADFHKINQLYLDMFLNLSAGQDRDLGSVTQTIEAYWQTIEQKTAAGFATACASGAMVGTDDDELIEACYTFGHHAGLTVQIFNDLESIWLPEGKSDLKQGKVTLPVLYGLQSDHPDREELAQLVENNQLAAQAERVREILDKINSKTFLIWSALKERDLALEAIDVCPNREGKEALEAFVTCMFGDIDELLPAEL